jgi:outer membrane protein OmpA-like peptidoglycan-associated protein
MIERCLWVLSVAAVSCGGTIKFEDRSAIAVQSTAPAKPEPQRRVELKKDRIVINEKIQFAYNSARILEQSHSLLDEISALLKENPQVKKVQIGGHASSEGSDAYNLSLSDQRAKAVLEYLTEKAQIDSQRLSAKGFGETEPLVTPDDTEQKRETNRRVEFLIREQALTKQRVEVDPLTGDERIVETFTETVKEK